MSLFQKSVEKKYLDELDSALIDKKFAEFKLYFGNAEIQENIRNSKEEQFQEGFLRELFVKILNYTLNPHPNFNLTTELKNVSDSKKADGAILRNENAIAVIELKSTDTTNLGKVEAQAFGYKNHHPKCVYVITSNFEKLRFYIQNAVNHFEFDLFKLTKEEFSLLWLCLAKDNLLNDLPLKIKESSLAQEENITKQLYADYSRFREALFQNLVKNNPDVDKLTLFKKTQKLIDRFLFIFFAEDKQLLPANSILQIIEKWKDDVDFGDVKSLYSLFRKYFHILNVGRPKSEKRQEIFAYNGGLFLTDEILENVKIDDEVLKEHTLKLSNYDFDTEIDVNILGHIFEHSLGEIENVQAEIKGENIDYQKTKRKKDGIFYTPKYITKYIVENTIGKLCEEKRNSFGIVDEEYAKGRKNRRKETIKELDEKLKKYQDWLLSLTILDPACGSGAFLNQALEFLIIEHRKIDELRAQLFGGGIIFSDISTDILEKNIYGVDINEESVEIAKLSLWLRTARKGRKLSTLSNNIKCGNSLIDDPLVAGEKAFNWQSEFPEIFTKGGFDVVIGNPPYVQHRKLFDISPFFKDTYKVYTGTSDLSVYFFEKGLILLKDDGLLGYINTNKFFNSEYGKPLRDLLSENKLFNIVNFEQTAIFKDALVSSVIIIGSKSKYISKTKYAEFNKEEINAEIFEKELISRERIIDREYLANNSWIFENPIIKKLIDKIKSKGQSLRETEGIKINRGITTGYDDGFLIDNVKYNELIKKDYKNELVLKPLLKGKHIKRYYIEKSDLWLINSHNGLQGKLPRINLELDYPLLYEHIISINKESNGKVENRSDKGEHWSNLRNCAFLEEFEKEKIIWGLISGDWNFSYDSNKNYLTSASYFLTSSIIPSKFILGILNSKLSVFYFKNVGEMTAGGAYVLNKVSVEKFILPETTSEKKEEVVVYVNTLEDLIHQYRHLSDNFINLLKAKLNIDTITNRLNYWYDLEFKSFLNELSKLKVKLNLTQESEWMLYFDEQKKKVQFLKSEINKTENLIDKIVYELYELTLEEIKIVEESF
jgi:type I restriction-modification system DNA methylase subunit